MKHHIIYAFALTLALLTACTGDADFATSPDARLTLSADTIDFDTVFSTVPAAYRAITLRNDNPQGLLITAARLKGGNQSGFRVNVNGTPLSQQNGYTAHDIELRSGDSLRVYAELTAPMNREADNKPCRITDCLQLTLQSGVTQEAVLAATTWDATLLRNFTIKADTTLDATVRPVVIYGTLTVNPHATLNIHAGSTLYFQQGASLHVRGTVRAQGMAEAPIVFRTARLDNLFSYLPYDNTPGRWGGVRIDSASYNNTFAYTDIHGATDAIVCDSSLSLSEPKLSLDAVTIHNTMGYGLHTTASSVKIENTQISNTLNNPLRLDGGITEVNASTIAQYYPFSASRKSAIRFANHAGNAVRTPMQFRLKVSNTIITGYADDEVIWSKADLADSLNARFDHCLLRTVRPSDQDSLMFVAGNLYESSADTLSAGAERFRKFDTTNFLYDFTPSGTSSAIGAADPATTPTTDRNGNPRKSAPDIGCYETRPVAAVDDEAENRENN